MSCQEPERPIITTERALGDVVAEMSCLETELKDLRNHLKSGADSANCTDLSEYILSKITLILEISNRYENLFLIDRSHSEKLSQMLENPDVPDVRAELLALLNRYC